MIMDRSLVLADFQLGSDQAVTPEGFLFCRNVPIARTGAQQYLNEELPELEGGRDGILHVERRPEDVFREETIRSFEGKPIVGNEEEEHPDEPIGPHNYKRYTVGTVLNPRRGEGPFNDLLIADLLIKDADAIAAVRAGKREVSCGYDADYEQLGLGKARQINIIGNHLALVKRGRCGSRCAIGDQDMTTKKTLFDKLLDFVSPSQQAAFKATFDAEGGSHIGGEGGMHIHVHGGPNGSTAIAPTTDEKEEEERKRREAEDGEMPPWFKKHAEDSAGWRKGFDDWRKTVDAFMTKHKSGDADMNEEVAEEEGEGEGESEGDILSLDAGSDEEELEEEEEEAMDKKKTKDKKKVKDSAVVAAAKELYRDVCSGAEILSPGIKLPTFDSITGPKLVDQMCILKRRAIRAHASTKDGAKALAEITGAKTLNLRTMDCASVGLLFNGAVAFAKDRNGREEIDLERPARRKTQDQGYQRPQSVSDFNTQKNEFWNKQNTKH